MNTHTIKTLALMGAVALGMVLTSHSAKAQTTVNAAITTSAAITVVDGVDMDFGTWFLAVVGADDFLLTMPSTGIVTASGNVASFATKTTPVDQAGTMTVSVPAAGIVLQMTRSAITDFADAGLTFQNTTYTTATQVGNNALAALAVPVTVVAAGVPEPITFGGQIHVTATPANQVHTASFTVSFAY